MENAHKSTFVTVVAWIFIAVAGLSTFVSLLQNIMISFVFPPGGMDAPVESAQAGEQIPFFVRFMLSNVRLFFFSFLVVSSTTLVSAIGLLKRKNWARILFMSVMGLATGWCIFALIVQRSMFTTIPAFPPEGLDSEFLTMLTIMKVASFVFAAGFSYLFGWIIYKLSTAAIKSEFVDLPVALPAAETGRRQQPARINAKYVVTGVLALTIALGVYYFRSTGMRVRAPAADIQEMAIRGDAVRLSRLLNEQPHLAYTIRRQDRWTPLHGAACNGNADCVRILIEAGADVNVQNCNQSTALHCGAEYGNAEIVALLLQGDADPNLADSRGRTPLDWAIWNNHAEVIELLKRYRAKKGTELKAIEADSDSAGG